VTTRLLHLCYWSKNWYNILHITYTSKKYLKKSTIIQTEAIFAKTIVSTPIFITLKN